MSMPSLVAKGCMLDLSLEARKQLPFLGITAPLHVVPNPPARPSEASSRHYPLATHSPVHRSSGSRSRPSTKAACHTLARRWSGGGGDDKATNSDHDVHSDSTSHSISQPGSREETSDGIKLSDIVQRAEHDETVLSNDLTISKGMQTTFCEKHATKYFFSTKPVTASTKYDYR